LHRGLGDNRCNRNDASLANDFKRSGKRGVVRMIELLNDYTMSLDPINRILLVFCLVVMALILAGLIGSFAKEIWGRK
jgi:hypothetical protein